MIRNIIFDMGNVIMHYDPPFFTSRVADSPEEAQYLLGQVFRAPEWPMLDEGTIELEEFDRRLKDRTGALYEKAHDLLYNWYVDLPVYPAMEALMGRLKEAGCRLYLLSNAGLQFHEYEDKIPAFRFLDGKLVSADVKCVKPDPKIFNILFEKFGLEASECLFIDDSPANVAAGQAQGMMGYCYKDCNVRKLEAYLKENHIL